jgi:hypothetical protein
VEEECGIPPDNVFKIPIGRINGFIPLLTPGKLRNKGIEWIPNNSELEIILEFLRELSRVAPPAPMALLFIKIDIFG